MGNNPSKWKGDSLPVEHVSWNDCHAFIQKVSAESKRLIRLPTEAEWEYACRAGTAARVVVPAALGDYGWFKGNSGRQTHPVGGKKANEWGLFDMQGNVWEWLQDCWNSTYTGAPTDGLAWLTGDCSRHVMRSSSWFGVPTELRSAFRTWFSAALFTDTIGFRLARDL